MQFQHVVFRLPEKAKTVFIDTEFALCAFLIGIHKTAPVGNIFHKRFLQITGIGMAEYYFYHNCIY